MRCGWSDDAVADAAVGLAQAVPLRVACSFGARGRARGVRGGAVGEQDPDRSREPVAVE